VGNFISRRYFRINLHASKITHTHTDPSGSRVKTARFIGLTGLSSLSAVLDIIPYILSAGRPARPRWIEKYNKQ